MLPLNTWALACLLSILFAMSLADPRIQTRRRNGPNYDPYKRHYPEYPQHRFKAQKPGLYKGNYAPLGAATLVHPMYKPYVPQFKRFPAQNPARYRPAMVKPEMTFQKPQRPKPLVFPPGIWEQPESQALHGLGSQGLGAQMNFKKPSKYPGPSNNLNSIQDYKFVQPQLTQAHAKVPVVSKPIPTPTYVQAPQHAQTSIPLDANGRYNEDKGPIHTIPAPNLSQGGPASASQAHYKPIIVSESPRYPASDETKSYSHNDYGNVGKQKYYAPDPDPKSQQNQQPLQVNDPGIANYGVQNFGMQGLVSSFSFGENQPVQQTFNVPLQYHGTYGEGYGATVQQQALIPGQTFNFGAGNFAMPIQNTISFQDSIPVLPVKATPVVSMALPVGNFGQQWYGQSSNHDGSAVVQDYTGQSHLHDTSTFESLRTDKNTNFMKPKFVSFNYNEETKEDSVPEGSEDSSQIDPAYYDLFKRLNANEDPEPHNRQLSSRRTGEAFLTNVEDHDSGPSGDFAESKLQSMISKLQKGEYFSEDNANTGPQSPDPSAIYEGIVGKAKKSENKKPDEEDDSELFHYTVLPNRKAAETLAKLQAAGEILSKHVGQIDKKRDDKTDVIDQVQSAFVADDHYYDDEKLDDVDFDDDSERNEVTTAANLNKH